METKVTSQLNKDGFFTESGLSPPKKEVPERPSDKLPAALNYLSNRFSVIPIGKDKIPIVKWAEFQTRLPSTEEVTEWFTKWPTAGIGIVTGKISNLTVIDCDDSLAIEKVEAKLPVNIGTLIETTPRGGRHFFFRYTPWIKQSQDSGKIHIRNDGGYIRVSPTPGYTMPDPLISTDDLDLVPDEIKKLISPNGEGEIKKEIGWNQEILSGVNEGERNGSLTKEAGRLVQKGLTKEEILPILKDINSRNKPPLLGGEVKKIVDSVFKTHKKNHPEDAFTQSGSSPPGEQVTDITQDLSYSSLNLPSSLEISQLEVKVEWVAQNLIPKESLTLLHSIGGVGKTYLMYQLARSVAEEEPFFNLNVERMSVYYIDFENPLSEIADRMKKIGGSEGLRIWHLGHDIMPVRFDSMEWGIYKTFPPGLFIIDSLRSSHLLEENSSRDAALIMARLKEIRSLGSTIVLIHHENKLGGYRGSTAWFDLSDHILKFSRVKKIGSDEDAEGDDFDLPIRLGLGGKSRFSSAMELKPMFFHFQDGKLVPAEDPDFRIIRKMAGHIQEGGNYYTAFYKAVSEDIELNDDGKKMGKKRFDRLLNKGSLAVPSFWKKDEITVSGRPRTIIFKGDRV